MGHDPDVDVRDGVEGFPAMPPVPEPVPQEVRPQDDPPGAVAPVQDYLISVTRAADARAALSAAETLVIVDGRATAWTVVAQLLYLGAFIGMFVVVDPVSIPFEVTWLVFIGLLVLSQLCLRAGGVQPRRPRARVIVAGLVVFLALSVAYIGFNLPRSWFLGLLAMCAAVSVVMPIVQWLRSRRRSSLAGWGPGTEAFAILSLLDGAGAVTPDYLGSRAGLDQVTRDSWIDRLCAEHAIMGGEVRRRPLGRGWVRITETGRERLASMRLELERHAAVEVPVT